MRTPEGSGAAGLQPGWIRFAAFWCACLVTLVYPPCAQMCAGMSRFVLLAGLVALCLAWPVALSPRQNLGRLCAFLPLLMLGLALDLRLGLHPERAVQLVLCGLILCLCSAWLGAVDPIRSPRWQGWLVGMWFLGPLALATWIHVVDGLFFGVVEALFLSPVGGLWTALPLLAPPLFMGAIYRLLLLLLPFGLLYLAVRRHRNRVEEQV